jgi:F-type H+-transporting ATPase subunit b
MDQAKKAEQKAEQRSLDLSKEKEAFLRSKERLLAEAEADVEAWREKTLKASRREIDNLRQSWMDRLNRDKEIFFETLKRRIAEQVIHVSDKVLRDLANQDLDNQIVEVFLEKVEEKREEFLQKSMARPVVVESGLAIDDNQVRRIKEHFDQWFPSAAAFRFEVEGALGLGIQIIAGDRKVAWHLSEYLEDLEKEIMADLFAGSRVEQ